MPPIRKGDGTGISPSGISQVRTGDGRILFDGPAKPDSVEYHFNAQELGGSDQDSITAIPDLIGDYDLTGSGTLVDDGINGNRSVLLDGSSDYFDGGGFFDPETQPIILYGAYESLQSSEGVRLIDGINDPFIFAPRFGNGDYEMFAGEFVRGGSPTTDPEVFVAKFDGANSEIRINGVQIATGDVGADSWDGITLGRSRDDDLYWDGYWGELAVALDDSIDTDFEQQIMDRWHI